MTDCAGGQFRTYEFLHAVLVDIPKKFNVQKGFANPPPICPISPLLLEPKRVEGALIGPLQELHPGCRDDPTVPGFVALELSTRRLPFRFGAVVRVLLEKRSILSVPGTENTENLPRRLGRVGLLSSERADTI